MLNLDELPDVPITRGHLPQNAKAGSLVSFEGARAIAAGGGEWVLELASRWWQMPEDHFALLLTPAGGSNKSEWRGVRFGVSLLGAGRRGWLVTSYANKTGLEVDAPLSFAVYLVK
jgi:hypothetical protein